ncbi:hypothetical protein [Ramlibacter rhizophilus]|uniref:TAXI family TRAP transporter solute-binding subunit n=1 Tax=Ramlibacter rhizophilus TaxID=1781167 RepID=A0A4Z0BW68_9BURK|nr:hypothetical protein [Ramlibacter rhizophilus]TFZ03473.1 hypothetical protein EZ242_06260 [Ramlibacter rhizophilus]
MPSRSKIALAAAALMLASTLAGAQAAKPAAVGPDAHHVLRIATGAQGKGFSRVFADLQAVCGQQVALSEVPTEGGLQNLTVLVANRADLGFVQVDTLAEMKGSDDSIKRLQTVVPMHANLLHVVARKDGYPRWGIVPLVGPLNHRWFNQGIDSYSDLDGLAVAVVGSARKLGRTLNQEHGLDIRFVDVETDEAAIAMVRNGDVAAMLTTSGWPSGPLQRLKRTDGLKLVRYDLPIQQPYQKLRKNYDNLDAWNVDFLAAENALVARPFTADGPKGRAVQALQSCIFEKLTQLQEGAFEPAWRDVRQPADGDVHWTRPPGAARTAANSDATAPRMRP